MPRERRHRCKRLERLLVVNHDHPLPVALAQHPGQQPLSQHAARRARIIHQPIDIHGGKVRREKADASHRVGGVRVLEERREDRLCSDLPVPSGRGWPLPLMLEKSPSSTYRMATACASWLFQASAKAATNCLMAAVSASRLDCHLRPGTRGGKSEKQQNRKRGL